MIIFTWATIAWDGGGSPHVAYTADRGGWNLFYATLTGGTWYTETVVSAPLESGTASLAVNSQDNPVICYSDLNLNTLNLATWTGTGWSFQIVDDSPWPKYGCDLKLDAAGQPHLAFNEIVTNVYGESYGFRYAHRDGGEWLIEPLGDQPVYAWPPKLALDSTGSPVIGYFDDKDQVTLTYKAGGVWQEEYPPYPYCLDSLVLDQDDLPWMTCTDQLNDLVLIRGHTQVNYLPVVGRDLP